MSGVSRTRALLVCLVTTSTGCEAILDYPVDRAKDLVDVIGLELYWGQGVVAHAQATKMVQLGLGTFDGDVMKYHRRVAGMVEEMRAEAGFPLYYFTIYDRKPLTENPEFLEQQLEGLGEVHYSLTDPHDRGFYDIGATLVAFFGVGVSIDLYQTLDFMTGWLGVDIGRDDARNHKRKPVANPRYKSTAETPISEGMRYNATTKSFETPPDDGA